jgi:phosphate transport system ATP-binding protein
VGATGHKFAVRELCAWFGDKRVLHGINLNIAAHEATAVIGPSGCGKSTFIRCLNRMHELVASARMEGDDSP